MQCFQQRKGHLQEEIQVLDREIDTLKQQRKNTPHHIPVNSLPEEERFTRLRTERKHFIDTIKMIAYRAESSLASLLREHLARSDDARALLRQMFDTEADLHARSGGPHTHRPAASPHASHSRSGHRTTARRTQHHPDRLSGHQPHARL